MGWEEDMVIASTGGAVPAMYEATKEAQNAGHSSGGNPDLIGWMVLIAVCALILSGFVLILYASLPRHKINKKANNR